MENKCKRFLSLLLAFVMVLGLFPMGHAHVHAAEDSIMVLEPVTEVTAGVEYVIKLHNTDHAMNSNVSEWKSGHTGIETAVTEDFTDSFKWILEEQTENSDQGSYKIRNVGANQCVVVEKDKGYLNDNGEGFNFTYTENGWIIRNPARPYGYFNNLGGSNKIGGWNSDGTKFDIYRFVEKDVDEVDPWGKRNWVKVSVDTETIYSATEGNFEYAWDGNLGTIWHSNWQGASDKLDGSNTFTGIIDFSKEHTINQFSFTPRTGNNSGQVTQASVYVKGAEGEWKLVAEHAEFAANGSKKTVCFETQAVQYVKFVAEQSNDGWVAVAEFDIDNVAGDHTITETVTRAADCTNTGVLTCTCTCGNVYTKKIPVNPENHTVVFNDAKKPTLCETGFTGNRVCGGCGISLSEGSEITQLPVANVLSDNKLVALNDCEYTYNGNSLTHTAADGTIYYVKPASYDTSPAGQAPQTTTEWTGLNLVWQENGSVWINGNGSLHIWSTKDMPYWDKCGNGHSWNSNNGTHDLYLFRANGELTGDVFPGYTQISSAEGMVTGEKYLIAAQKGDAWYIMHPSASNNAYDHLALVSGELHTITGHNYDEGVYTDPTYEADGYTTYTCSICGHSYTEVDEGSSLKNNFASELITGITGEASSNDAGDGSNIEEAFDGIKDNASNYWASVANAAGIENNEYLIANLGGKYLINQVAYTSRTVANATGNLHDYVIWVSTDGANWEKVASGAIETLPGTTTITFAPVEATHVKLTATKSYHWQSGSVNTVMAAAEFEVFKAVCVEHTPGAEATCTEDQICTVCGTVLVAAHHTPAEPVVENEKDATCTEDGSYDSVVYCSVCKAELSRETNTVDTLGHTAGEPVVENEKAATCAADGSYDSVVYCSVCKAELSRETNTIPALEHTPAEAVKENEKAATCTEDGSYDLVVYCSVCKAEISRETNTVDALGHDEIPHEAKDPTCTESGWDAYVTCSRCDYTTYEEIPAVGHTDKNGDYICDVCGEALCTDHDWIDATCTAPKTCSKCGVTEGKALGHTEQTVKGHPGTCFEPGLSDGVICSVCGTVLVAQEETAPVHTLIVHVDASAPTCTKNGNIEYWYCVECGSAWLDEECRFNTNLRAIILPATGHSYEAVFTQDPTCTEHGYTSYACTVCGHTIVGDYVTALGHNPGEPVIENEKDATCTEDGSYDSVVYCTVCEEELSRETNTVDALGHTAGEPVVENEKAATCTEDGSYDSVVYCSVCKAEISRETNTVDALGHTAGEPVVENEKAASCTEDGSYDSVVYCTVCEAEISRETNTVDALGHKPSQPVVENEKAATCTEDGSYDNVVYCTVCDAEISRKTETVPAKGHRFSKVEVTPATCTEDGYVTITCGNCNKTFVSGKDAEADQYLVDHPYFDLKAKGHTAGEPVIENEKDATCTEDGSYDTVVYCTVCEAEISRETNTVDALGHKPGQPVVENEKAATCTEDGSYDNVVYCTVCDAEISRETVPVPAKGHRFSKVEVTPATCTEDGYVTITCGNCNKTFVSGKDAEADQYLVDHPYFDLKAKGHTAGEPVVENEKAATCTEDGSYDIVVYCTVCDAEISRETTAIPAAHSYVNGGYLTQRCCTVCNAICEGFDNDSLYINGWLQQAYQLVEYQGAIYFVGDAHKIVKDTTYYLTEEFTNDKFFPDGRAIQPGYYEFDADGKMVIPEAPAVKNGVIDGYLYIDDQMQKAYKLVEFEGSLYFISDAHKVAVSTSLYLNENFVAGVMVPGTDRELVPGYYEFDAEGKMLIPEAPAVKNGVIDGYLYINDQMQKAYQLVEFEGSLYFISDAHKVAVSTSLYLNEDFVANVKIPGTDKALKPGYYEFDAEGKMVITEVKEGVIDGYLYIDGEMQLAYQLVEFENHIYFVYDAHKIAVSTRLYLSEQFVEGKTFNGEPIAVGYYEFDENGWMIIE